MNNRRQQRRLVADINVVPYIDVMLVLLVIFMITTPLLTQGVEINLPKAEAKTLTEKQKMPMIVSVDKAGHYFLNVADKPNQPLTSQALVNFVSAQLALAKSVGVDRQVFIRGDKAVDYGAVVGAMTLLQKAGVENIGLITEEPQKTS